MSLERARGDSKHEPFSRGDFFGFAGVVLAIVGLGWLAASNIGSPRSRRLAELVILVPAVIAIVGGLVTYLKQGQVADKVALDHEDAISHLVGHWRGKAKVRFEYVVYLDLAVAEGSIAGSLTWSGGHLVSQVVEQHSGYLREGTLQLLAEGYTTIGASAPGWHPARLDLRLVDGALRGTVRRLDGQGPVGEAWFEPVRRGG